MSEDRTPTVLQRRLGVELRKLRERAGLSVHDAARPHGWSGSKISRIETCRTLPTPKDVARLCSFYRADKDTTEFLIRLARNSGDEGWWDHYGITGEYASYIAMESAASEIETYSQVLIPGLLQTKQYADTVLRARLEDQVPEDEIARQVAIRMRRQEVLYRENPVQLRVILEEYAVRHMVGGPDVMGAQLEYLIQLNRLPNVSIQLLPSDVGAHPAMNGPFTVMRFPEHPTLAAVAVELVGCTVWLEESVHVHRLGKIFRYLGDRARDPRTTTKMLRTIVQNL